MPRMSRTPGSRLRTLIGAIIFCTVLGGLVSAQGTLSEQVLRLLVRNNYWSGIQTFGRTVGVTLESGLTPPVLSSNTLYNLGGNLYWNGALVSAASGAGTVTSVGLSLPAIFTVSGSPVVASGTLTGTFATQAANQIFAGPISGADDVPTFRTLVAADLPAVPASGITGTVPVANGGTGLTAGTSGGVLAFTDTGTIASSAALTANRIVLGGGAGAAPTVLGSLGTTTTVLHGNAAGAPVFSQVSLTADVSGTLPVGNGGTGITSGTSGGLLYLSGTTTIAASGAFASNQLLIGGGAGAAPAALGSLGTATTVLHGNVSGAPSFGALVLTTDVTGVLGPTNGGLGLSTATQGDLIYASASNTWAALAKSATATRYLSNTGSSNNPAWAQVDLTNGVTGTLPAANGGTSVTSTPTNGQLLIGNGSGFTLATLTGTADQITVTNGAGSITLATPQSINTTSTPQFARLGLGVGAGGTAVITTAGQFDLGQLDLTSCGASKTVDFNLGMTQKTTLTAVTCALTFSNPITGAPPYTLILAQDGTGGRLVSWPAGILWEGGAAPTLTTTATAIDICTFLWNGTNYLGRCALDYE